jgi:hypothetical protein
MDKIYRNIIFITLIVLSCILVRNNIKSILDYFTESITNDNITKSITFIESNFFIILIICILIRINIKSTLDYFTESITNDNIKKFISVIESNLSTDQKNLIIIPHTELGDAFVINGAIRHYSKIYDKIIYVCRNVYYEQISFMYADNKNILIYPINLGGEIYTQIINHIYINKEIENLFDKYNIDFIPMKYFKNIYEPRILSNTIIKRNNDLIDYPNFMYDELNLDPNIRYTQFKINRDYNRENELYNKLVNIIGKDYIIIIDDNERNYKIDTKYIQNKNLPVYYLGNKSQNKDVRLDELKDPYVVNYIKLLENATEIHTIESSIHILIDQLSINNNVYIHAYLRNGNINNRVTVHNNNKIFKYIYTN